MQHVIRCGNFASPEIATSMVFGETKCSVVKYYDALCGEVNNSDKEIIKNTKLSVFLSPFTIISLCISFSLYGYLSFFLYPPLFLSLSLFPLLSSILSLPRFFFALSFYLCLSRLYLYPSIRFLPHIPIYAHLSFKIYLLASLYLSPPLVSRSPSPAIYPSSFSVFS